MSINGCTCYSAWAAIMPPPPCAVHGPRPYPRLDRAPFWGDPPETIQHGQVGMAPELFEKLAESVREMDQLIRFPCGYDERDAKV